MLKQMATLKHYCIVDVIFLTLLVVIFNLRGFAERTAMNTPIQGSAADIIKLAMVEFDKQVQHTSYKAKLLLQVHDELIFEVPKSEVEEFSLFVEDIMEHALDLDVPLKVDSNYGPTWYDAK